MLGGIDEAIAILKLCAGHELDGIWIPGFDELTSTPCVRATGSRRARR